MAEQLGPIGIECDAPPYIIVRACERVGLRCPLDCRWCELGHFLEKADRAHGLRGLASWLSPLGRGPASGRTCSCGQPLPSLELCAFGLSSGVVAWYSLGQCRRCRTVFWQQR